MAVYVCGDTHGTVDIEKLRNWDEGQNLTKKDHLIILGDAGIVFSPRQNTSNYGVFQNHKELEIWKEYQSFPWTTLFLDGNHCNFDRLFSDEFKEMEVFGDVAKEITGGIFYLQRGHIYNIENHTFFTFGGGISIDKNQRQEHVSWWKEELPSYAEIDLGVKTLESYNSKVDYILTHSAPQSLMTKMAVMMGKSSLVDERPLTSFLDWVEEHVEYKGWHFGHLHMDHQFDDKHFVHYNNKPMRLV